MSGSTQAIPTNVSNDARFLGQCISGVGAEFGRAVDRLADALSLASTITEGFAAVQVALGQSLVSIQGVQSKLDQVLARQDVLEAQGVKLMALADDIKVAIKNLDDETSLVAANIANLAAKIKNSMTDAEVQEIKDGFGVLSTRLDVLGKDPTTPVPPPPPVLQSLRKKI